MFLPVVPNPGSFDSVGLQGKGAEMCIPDKLPSGVEAAPQDDTKNHSTGIILRLVIGQ